MWPDTVPVRHDEGYPEIHAFPPDRRLPSRGGARHRGPHRVRRAQRGDGRVGRQRAVAEAPFPALPTGAAVAAAHAAAASPVAPPPSPAHHDAIAVSSRTT